MQIEKLNSLCTTNHSFQLPTDATPQFRFKRTPLFIWSPGQIESVYVCLLCDSHNLCNSLTPPLAL